MGVWNAIECWFLQRLVLGIRSSVGTLALPLSPWQFYSAVFFDSGCTIHQHFDVRFHIVQLLLQWRKIVDWDVKPQHKQTIAVAQWLFNSLKLLNSLKTTGELEYEWSNFATVKEF